jgi:hypothetical protein
MLPTSLLNKLQTNDWWGNVKIRMTRETVQSLWQSDALVRIICVTSCRRAFIEQMEWRCANNCVGWKMTITWKWLSVNYCSLALTLRCVNCVLEIKIKFSICAQNLKSHIMFDDVDWWFMFSNYRCTVTCLPSLVCPQLHLQNYAC